MKRDTMWLKNNLERLKEGRSTMFLDPKEQKELELLLKKEQIFYRRYEPFKEAEHVIFYTEEKPEIIVLEVRSNHPLEHRTLMGTLFHLGIDPHTFGDILISDSAYLFVLPQVSDLIQYECTQVGREKVKVVISNRTFEEYERSYQTLLVKAPSLRIDAVLSKLLHLSRSKIEEKLNANDLLLNYEICRNGKKQFKEQDVFSIRTYGKYRFKEEKEKTKKGAYVLEILKYK